jgi:ATP-dependent RNA helicase RhlB
MLDMGFIPDVRNIVHSTPHKGQRQTLFFTATLTQDVIRLANQWTTDPITVEIAPEQVAVDTVNQVIYIVTIKEKFALLYNVLTRDNADRVIVFANRRDEAERLCDYLRRYDINSALLSGAVPQHKRLRVLEDFKAGKIRVLVATDVAGRGLHVESVSHVINYNLPIDPEDYVHRIGRTGRAGALGTSVSFADEDDAQQIPAIEKYIGRTLPCTHPQEEWLKVPPPIHPEIRRERPSGPPRGRSGSGRGPRRGGGGRRGPPRRH